MTKKDLENKAELLKQALSGTRTSIDTISIDVDKETFKALYVELGEPNLHEPKASITDYWFMTKINDFYFMINYKAKAVTTYEAL